MDLAHDLFMVSVEGGETSDELIVATIKDAGFGGEIQDRGVLAAESATDPTADRGPVPAMVQAALDQAGREGKLVLLDFDATWCAPCIRMAKETYPDPAVQAALKRFVFLEIDTDEQPEAAKWYRVVSIPDARILAPDGRELGRFNGFKEAAAVVGFLKAAADAFDAEGK